MNKYKKLISNTAIFAIGTFSSKVLVYLMMPLYTRVLSTAEYGVTDLVVQTGNLLLPLVSLGIINGVVRFGLDRSVRKSDVFSTGLLSILGGFCLLLLFAPLINKIKYVSDYTMMMYFFVFMSSMRSLCSQFVKARGLVRLYALDGILSTITTILFNILFLVGFRWGALGYILAIICSDTLSVLFLFITAGLTRYIRFRGMDTITGRAMLGYSLPLIPNTVFWWIITMSDRYIVAYMLGSQANGLLAAAYKIPTLIQLVSSIFMDAWQLSAVTEEQSREKFFTKVFRCYGSLVFMAGSGLILFSKLITKLMVSQEFYSSWKYIPFLVMATVFSCLVNFLGSIYMVEKKSLLTLLTTAAGAIVNIVLNFLLIPIWGVTGAVFATFIGYFVVFLLRAMDTRRFIKMRWNALKTTINTFILFGQSLIMIMELPLWIVWEILLTALMLVLNSGEIIVSLRRALLPVLQRRKLKKGQR
ncbi:lipopolysaccharide biosynthesis protein [Zongyangia hominis]|uniref:Polysaccharide biosynthesis C-terminal domain-containing protein n=1 Tax=Zongyangia hominis TaxID=2763677 RepID=A0A926I5X1_9FIRM|nr:polysaccharide biosynthesis C-terminal domain-containing protein [Zongyangia hominis]MBC8569354.1 polysaccharide biosynthesis C-terminal domain-containing protein [Zongyangia hominis]